MLAAMWIFRGMSGHRDSERPTEGSSVEDLSKNLLCFCCIRTEAGFFDRIPNNREQEG